MTTESRLQDLEDTSYERQKMTVDLHTELNGFKARMIAVETGLKENTAVTEAVGADARELLDIFRSVKGGFKVLTWLGTFAKWVAGIAAAFAAIYAFVVNIKGH